MVNRNPGIPTCNLLVLGSQAPGGSIKTVNVVAGPTGYAPGNTIKTYQQVNDSAAGNQFPNFMNAGVHSTQFEDITLIPFVIYPNDLPGLALWHSADVGVYSDLGTTPAANGGSVEQWNDQSGNALHATQTGAAGIRPVFKTNIQNGLPALQFTAASSQFLNAAYLATQPGTILCVYSVNKAAPLGNTEAPLLNAYAAAGAQFCWGLRASSNQGTYNNAGWFIENTISTLFSSISQPAFNVVDILGVQQAQTKGVLTRWGVCTATPATAFTGSPNVPTSVTIGSEASAGFLNGNIHELIVFSNALTNTQYNGIVNYLIAKWGITVPAGNYFASGVMFGNTGADVVDLDLYLMQSSDGIHWNWRPTMLLPHATNKTNTQCVHDPAILLATQSSKTGGLNWLVASNYPSSSVISSNTLDLYTSPDLYNWTYNQSISGGNVPGCTAMYNPGWFTDVDGSVHIVTGNYSGTSNKYFMSEYHPVGSMLGGWTGGPSDCNPLSSLGVNQNGPQIVNVGGQYYQFYSYSLTPFDIGFQESSQNFTGYTGISGATGGFGNWRASIGTGIEQSGFLNINGTYFGYVDNFGAAPRKTFYSTLAGVWPGATGLTGQAGLVGGTGTWSAPATISTNLLNNTVIEDMWFARAFAALP